MPKANSKSVAKQKTKKKIPKRQLATCHRAALECICICMYCSCGKRELSASRARCVAVSVKLSHGKIICSGWGNGSVRGKKKERVGSEEEVVLWQMGGSKQDEQLC